MRIPVATFTFVLAIVEHQNKFLLAQEAKPERHKSWYLPAGGVDPYEDLVTAAIRETQEETGIVVEPTGILWFEHELYDTQRAAQPRARWRFFLTAKPVGGTLKKRADKHSLQAGWFSLSEARRLPLRSTEVLTALETYTHSKVIVPISLYRMVRL